MRFSVIIPLYNKAPYVAKAIGSVLVQTFSDYELVIVDDGSKDHSAEVAKNAIEGQEQCRLISQENAGVSMARNSGVAASHGDYLCFLDADDWWETAFLEEMDKLIGDFPDAGIYGTNYTIINETKHKTGIAPIGLEQGFERGYINYFKAYSEHLGMPLWPGSVCVPRGVFDEMHGFPKDIKLGEDFMLWVHIGLQYKVAFLNKPLSNYNQDVELNNRAVGHLHAPKHHMLWNLSDLEAEGSINPDYKELIDQLRVTGLMQYYISSEYHDAAVAELNKVDWSKQPKSLKRRYRLPVYVLRIRNRVMAWGSAVKTRIKKTI